MQMQMQVLHLIWASSALWVPIGHDRNTPHVFDRLLVGGKVYRHLSKCMLFRHSLQDR